MRRLFMILSLSVVVSAVGCGPLPKSNPAADPSSNENSTEESSTEEQADASEEEEQTTPHDVNQSSGILNEEARPFTANAPKQGKLSREKGGYLGRIVGTKFTAINQLTIHSITHAQNLYRAEHGDFPKTHEEFMEKIIKFNALKLPELEEGFEYIYDTKTHTLKIQPIAKTT